jgi:transposase
MKELLVTKKALERERVLKLVLSGKYTQREAAEELNLSRKRVNQLFKKYQLIGLEGLLSKRIGMPSNNRYKEGFRNQVKRVISQPIYADFKPTLLSEVLSQDYEIVLSKETLRQWMIEWGLWISKRTRQKPIHCRRARRSQRGELVQIDGSHHDWFEGRCAKCCLIVFIDDASGHIMAHFSPTETGFAYMACIEKYIKRYGIPKAFYHDRASVFTVTESIDRYQRVAHTQLGRVFTELGIESIKAYSPQAKGRVERANGTLQDRLVKQLRLKGINTIDQGNVYLTEFIEHYNQKFGIDISGDVHRDCQDWSDEKLKHLMTYQETRRIDNALCLQYKNTYYQIQSKGGGHHLKGKRVKVITYPNGTIKLYFGNHYLQYKTYTREGIQKIANEKDLNEIMDKMTYSRKLYRPDLSHPWKQGLNARNRRLEKQQTEAVV